ncbi:MAG TPA: hypothetical protein GX696_06385 [Pseudomonadaceae bacterium]|nr:hypothetical protein [Pseudomonadaceae bacterium]
MAINSVSTSARALETAQIKPPSVSHALRDTFCDLLECLAHLLEIEAFFASDASFDPAFAVDPAESVHAYATVHAAAMKVRKLPPVWPGDKALKLAALLVDLAIGMEEAMDRVGVHEMIAHARVCLLLEADASEAAVTNHLLRIAFVRLERLAALETDDAPLPHPDEHDAAPEPAFCV